MHNKHSAMNLSDSTVSGNSATVGGGVYNRNNGTLALTDSMVLGNTASGVGGVRNYQVT